MKKMNHLFQKIAIITGASSGIGKSLALELASQGAIVVIAARREMELMSLENEIIQNYKTECLTVVTDVSKQEDCRKLIEKTLERFGRIDILINNAGVSQRVIFEDVKLDVIEKIMAINYWGTVYCTKFALPHIMKTKGSIIGVSSVSGYSPLPGRTGYCSSKYAMHGFLESLRIELFHTGVHVMIATPGFTTSEIRVNALIGDGQKQGFSPRDESKMMTSEKVAKIIVKGIIKRKRTKIIGLEGKIIVFLTRYLPKFTDKLIYKQMAKEKQSPLK